MNMFDHFMKSLNLLATSTCHISASNFYRKRLFRRPTDFPRKDPSLRQRQYSRTPCLTNLLCLHNYLENVQHYLEPRKPKFGKLF